MHLLKTHLKFLGQPPPQPGKVGGQEGCEGVVGGFEGQDGCEGGVGWAGG